MKIKRRKIEPEDVVLIPEKQRLPGKVSPSIGTVLFLDRTTTEKLWVFYKTEDGRRGAFWADDDSGVMVK